MLPFICIGVKALTTSRLSIDVLVDLPLTAPARPPLATSGPSIQQRSLGQPLLGQAETLNSFPASFRKLLALCDIEGADAQLEPFQCHVARNRSNRVSLHTFRQFRR